MKKEDIILNLIISSHYQHRKVATSFRKWFIIQQWHSKLMKLQKGKEK
jgi:hypothetical protein